jgi:hypothetical protein
MVLGAESVPPAVGVKENVNETPALLTTRLLLVKRNDIKLEEPPIEPDGTETEAMESIIVCTVTAPPEVGVLLIVKPTSVTVTAVLAASAAPPTVMTMEVLPGAPGARVAPLVERVALGVAVAAKKPDG